MKECYKRENFEKIVKESVSVAEVLRKMGLADRGSNFATAKKYIKLYDLDTSHFLGQTWNKGLEYDERSAIVKLDDILKEGTNFKANNLKLRLLKAGLKENKCEKCGLENEWMGRSITLELHHINGDHFDNRLENLQILCPNCHSQTPNFRNKQKREKRNVPKTRNTYDKICKQCGKEFKTHNKRTQFCSAACVQQYRKANYINNQLPPLIDEQMLKNAFDTCHSIAELANYFKTNRTSIRNYLDRYGLYSLFKTKYATNEIHAKKAVLKYDAELNLLQEYESIMQASIENNISTSAIYRALKSGKSYNNFIWKYKKQ